MYPLTGYGGHSHPVSYSSFTPSYSLNSPGNSPLALISGNTSLISNKSRSHPLTTSHYGSPHQLQSQASQHLPRYSPSNIPGMSNSALSSPTDHPISPQESLLGDTQEKDSVSPPSFFDFSGYVPTPPKNRTLGLSNSSVTSSYFTPTLPFPTPNAVANGSAYTPPIYPSSLYNQYPETNTSLLETPSPQGISPYPALPYMSNRSHHKTLPKLSYDSPRYKLTPERAVPLIKWFDEHKDHPYPTRHEKILLCQGTQLTFTQVSTWFANARRRMKKASLEEEEAKSSSNCSSPESPNKSSTEEKSSVVGESTFTSSAVVTVDKDVPGKESVEYENSQSLHSSNLWNSSVY